MKKVVSTLMILIAISPFVSAQETVIFSKEGRKSSTSKKKSTGEENIVKISPLSFIGGVIPVYYERAINDFFSIQAGLGVTSKNYLKDALAESDFYVPNVKSIKWSDGSPSSTYQNMSSLTDYNNRKAKIGYYASIEPRVYFDDDGLSGGFIGISYSTAKFKADAQKIVTGVPVTGDPTYSNATFSEYEKTSDIMVTFGTQTLYDHISLEYNIGLGVRSLKGERYAYSSNFGASTPIWIDGVAETEKAKLNFNLSVKVGYHF